MPSPSPFKSDDPWAERKNCGCFWLYLAAQPVVAPCAEHLAALENGADPAHARALAQEMSRLRLEVYRLPWVHSAHKYDTTLALWQAVHKACEAISSSGPCGVCGQVVEAGTGYKATSGPLHSDCAVERAKGADG